MNRFEPVLFLLVAYPGEEQEKLADQAGVRQQSRWCCA
jgi:hypothetical protein